MKKNSRTWKILEALKQSESSQDDNNKVDELAGRGLYFETISSASFGAVNNYTGSSAEQYPTDVTTTSDYAPHVVFQTPQDLVSPTISLATLENVSLDAFEEEPQPSTSKLLTTLEDVSLIDLNEDLYLSHSSEDEYVPHDRILSSSGCSSDHIVDGVVPQDGNSDNRELLDINIEMNTTDVSGVESVIPGHQNRKRKRRGQAEPSEWKKNARKIKRQQGEPYISSKGVLKPGKTIGESKCLGLCREKCMERFSEEERIEIFSSFWNICDINQKRQYIVGLIKRAPTQTRRTTNLNSKRKMTNKYFLKKNGKTEMERVCQKFFLATLSVSETFVRFCFKKLTETNVVEADKRGKHVPHNKKSEDTKQFIRDHINSFPRMPAHYVRKDTRKEFLDQDLNVTKMYELYKIKCDEEQKEPVDIAYYRMIFNKDFNIGFYRPRKDACDKCFIYQHLSEEEKEKQKEEHEEHLKRKVTSRRHRDEDKLSAQSGDIHFVEYDLESICHCPSTSSKLIFYKRRIALFNFTMLDFEAEKRNVYCYCWNEGIGRKGAIEIGSCLLNYLKTKADGRPITFMSDTCASQCRNMYISALLLYCIEAFDIPEINQKYFEPGHSQMEADNIHATIEQAKKNIPVFHPSGFYTIVRKASRKSPYNVYEMETKDFVDLKCLKTILIKNAKIDCDGNAVNWLKIKWLQYRKEDTKHIYFKYDMDDTDFKKIQVIRRGKRLPVEKIILKNAYDKPLPISAEKYEDLQDLCRQGIIPTQYHNFYEQFTVGTVNDEEDN